MPLSGAEGEVARVLEQFRDVVYLGLAVSTVGYVSYHLTEHLAEHTRIERLDPTYFARAFESLYDSLFDPVGTLAAAEYRSPRIRQTTYQLGVGAAVVGFSAVLYLAVAGLLVGVRSAAYRTAGFTVEVMPFFRAVVALVVLASLAVMFHSQTRAKETDGR